MNPFTIVQEPATQKVYVRLDGDWYRYDPDGSNEDWFGPSLPNEAHTVLFDGIPAPLPVGTVRELKDGSIAVKQNETHWAVVIPNETGVPLLYPEAEVVKEFK